MEKVELKKRTKSEYQIRAQVIATSDIFRPSDVKVKTCLKLAMQKQIFRLRLWRKNHLGNCGETRLPIRADFFIETILALLTYQMSDARNRTKSLHLNISTQETINKFS